MTIQSLEFRTGISEKKNREKLVCWSTKSNNQNIENILVPISRKMSRDSQQTSSLPLGKEASHIVHTGLTRIFLSSEPLKSSSMKDASEAFVIDCLVQCLASK